MIRRFVNLVAVNKSGRTYSLHRLDVSKHLFYQSTEEANANKIHNGGRPSKIEKLRRLLPVSMHFHQFPNSTDRWWWLKDDKFVLLNSHSSEGRILHLTEEGPAFLYDADARSMSAIPSRDGPVGSYPKFISIAGDGAEFGEVYLISNLFREDQDDCPNFEVLKFNEYKWRSLPLPPSGWRLGPSLTTVDGGHTICVSSSAGTNCFDTRSQEWKRTGDWKLPFHDRAHYVPELDTWIGFSSRFALSLPYDLSASSDLSDMDGQCAPTLQHVWEDFNLPLKKESIVLSKRFLSVTIDKTKRWTHLNQDLLNLGGGRFCIAKFFCELESVTFADNEYDETGGEAMAESCTRNFVMLTGVEVLRGGESGEAGLRMVKHRSK